MASVEVPVNMPTSSTLFAPVSRTSAFRKLPSSPPAQQFAVCRNRVFFCAPVHALSASDACRCAAAFDLREMAYLFECLVPVVRHGRLNQILADLQDHTASH